MQSRQAKGIYKSKQPKKAKRRHHEGETEQETEEKAQEESDSDISDCIIVDV
jgi:hypothetical protein